MNVAIGVLTYNVFANRREDLLATTINSLRHGTGHPATLIVVDNGSSDGTADHLRDLRRKGIVDHVYVSTDRNHTSAHGNNLAAVQCNIDDPDLIVLSDDDVRWGERYLERLVDFWASAPEHVKLAGGHLEPEYAWSEIHGTGDAGGEHYLLRSSTGAATWSLRGRDFGYLFPLYDEKQGVGDLDGCRRLLKQGFQIAQLDLAEHLGENRSSWGNRTGSLGVAPLDRKKWGF